MLIVADGKGNEDEERGRVSIHDLGCPCSGRFSRMLLGPWMAFFAIRRIKPDIIHFHDPELISVGLLLKVQGKKVIYDVHEDYPRAILSKHYLFSWVRRLIAFVFEKFEEISAKFFSGIVSVTPVIAKRFERLNKNTVTVQNFPILNELHTDEIVQWEKRSNAVGYVGVISKLRGAKEMVEAINLASKKIDTRLILAGNFSPQSLKREVESVDGWKQTEYLCYLSREKVKQLLGRIRAGLVLIHPEPRYQVSYPIKLFEYMSAGIPVIASNFPLWKRIVDENKCGICVNPLEPKEIAKAIEYLMEHPVEAEKMGENGREAALEEYNWEQEMKKLLKLYAKLCRE